VRRFALGSLWTVLLAALAVGGVACDGGGWQLPKESRTPIDDNPDNGGNPPDGGGTPPPSGPTTFNGAWMAAFSDSETDGVPPQQYALRLSLTQSNQNLTGTGTLVRVIREVTGSSTDAIQESPVQITGTASGPDATIEMRPTSAGFFGRAPLWYLRISSSRTQMAGLLVETDVNGSLVRAAHARFDKIVTGNLINTSWAAAFSDEFAVDPLPRQDRSAIVALAVGTDGRVAGEGAFYVPQANGVVLEQDFSVLRGGVQGAQFGVTFGGGNAAGLEFDWVGFFSSSRIAAAYGQFNTQGDLVRFGHADYYLVSQNPGAGEINRTWLGAWDDREVAQGLRRGAYVATLTLNVEDGGQLAGSASLWDQSAESPGLTAYTVENGRVRGSRLTFDMVSSTRRFEWDMQIAGTVLVGTYRAVNGQGQFLSLGTATFRLSQSPSLQGAWTAAYVDTFGATRPEQTQLATMDLNVAPGGSLSGAGAFRYAGEDTRRVFTATGSVTNGNVTLSWTGGAGVRGNTVWRLRQGPNILAGTYRNETTEGGLESYGYAVFIRAAASN